MRNHWERLLMEKLKMRTHDIAEENYKKLAALFPNTVTETTDENGKIVRAIDKESWYKKSLHM